MAVPKIPRSFLILSETHNHVLNPSLTYPLDQPLPKVDVLLHCGDLTKVGATSAFKAALKMLAHFDAELKLVIAGNRDLDLDAAYVDNPSEYEENVEIMTGPLAKAAGVTYLTEGTYRFTLSSGAKFSIFAPPFTPAFGDYAFGYQRGEGRWRIPEGVGCCYDAWASVWDSGSCQRRAFGLRDAGSSDREGKAVGYGFQVKEWQDEKPGAHESRSIQISKAGTDAEPERFEIVGGRSTLMINAAIMHKPAEDESENNTERPRPEPSNAPWLVHIPLDRA
ncbi:hypothetical protein LTR78_003532 [Recurvomyces mirabilis]|uniref:Calcineurin-like phosphoesterase domain-containing protein n=1 Tax=Recurvomyces mirabilis TaxID=574656 RepID=A0AAE0WS27_9PEZI|nr:hypothetical protein LTR78_003532 [Recurvomyces mirabilis]KAK5154437.1 hypothetical protein LTS14_006572 [Recurvomyces mirabilis]